MHDVGREVTQAVTIEEALEQILTTIGRLPTEKIALLAAHERVLAEVLTSPCNLPPFDNSAMDGYAVRAADLLPQPTTLQVVGEVAAGQVSPLTLQAGQAIRIMTGAAVPSGADSVVKFEDTDEAAKGRQPTVTINVPIAPGCNVRRAGEDLKVGELALPAGSQLTPAAVGLAASLGYTALNCYRRPRVALIATGDELIPPGQPLAPGKIYNSNNYILAGQIQQAGAELLSVTQAVDEQGAIRQQLLDAIRQGADLIVTTGGVSVGDFDLVKQVLQSEGKMYLWQVLMRPGKPLAFGHIGDIPLLGLPGNPMAALVCFEIFGRAILAKMQGLENATILPEAYLNQPVKHRGGRRHFMRGQLSTVDGRLLVKVVATQGAAHLSSAALSNCLVVAHEDRQFYEAGEKIQVMPLGGTFRY